METIHHSPWDTARRMFLEKVDRWMTRRPAEQNDDLESEWLGWDGWVRTDRGSKRPRH